MFEPQREAELREELSRGIDNLRGGRSMAIGGLVLYRDDRHNRFIVICYSDRADIGDTTPQEAQHTIGAAKEGLAAIFALFPDVREETHGLPLVYYFAHDYGMGASVVATEEDGRFEYLRDAA